MSKAKEDIIGGRCSSREFSGNEGWDVLVSFPFGDPEGKITGRFGRYIKGEVNNRRHAEEEILSTAKDKCRKIAERL